MATVSENPPQPAADYFNATSGATEPVWVHTEPYSARPHFSKLERDVETDVCVVGAGIAGIQTSYELVTRGFNVVLLEAREILSGETGRTSGHLASALDDGYTLIAGKHGQEGAQIAADSHQWAINRVGDVAKKLGIDCEYRLLPGYEFSQYDRVKQPKEHAEENKELEEEVSKAQELGLKVEYDADFKLRGWDGEPDQRGAAIFRDQATFHPTKYLNGVLKWLKEQPNFHCFTHTRVMDFSEKGIEIGPIGHKTVELKTIDGYTVKAQDAV